VLRFQVAQHNRDIELMKSLITYLGCGRVEGNSKSSMVYFVVSRFEDIIKKVIPFFDKYPIFDLKSLDFMCFKNVAKIMEVKAHLTSEGLEQIRTIKAEMNTLSLQDQYWSCSEEERLSNNRDHFYFS
jgi:hypothetical protein